MRVQNLKISKYTLLFLLLVAFVILEFFVMSPDFFEKNNTEDYVANDFDKNNVAADDDKKNIVEQKALGIHLVENGDNKKSYQLFANEAVGTSDMRWVLKTVKIQFYNENKVNYTVAGDVGEIDGDSKDIIIRGRVTTGSSNGYSFKTETLRYISKQKIMTSDDTVIMEGPSNKSGKGFILTGEKLFVDLIKDKMSILNKITATKLINEKRFLLTSTRADFSNNNREVTFSGDVKMNLGTFYVQAPIVNFYYSKHNNALTLIVLKQGVAFTDGDRKGTCDRLEMDLIENKMTLRGQPKVQQGADEIRGQEIVFIDGGKKVRINKTNKLKQGTKQYE